MKRQTTSTSPARPGFTYIELVASITIIGILMLSIAPLLTVTNQTFDSRGSVVAQRAASGEILNDLADDLRHAISFSLRTATAIEFTVPDRTGDELPDTVRYSWGGAAGDPLIYSFNGSTPVSIADDVHQFDLQYISAWMPGHRRPPIAGSSVLFVVGNPESLTTAESSRRDLLESWGYTVTLINDGDTQASFDSAIAVSDVVYVSTYVSSGILGDKLNGAAIGVVNEDSDMAATLGFTSQSSDTVWQDWIEILSDDHYITMDFPPATRVEAFGSNELLYVIYQHHEGPASFNLAETSFFGFSSRAIVTLDPGDELEGGGEAAGRRVHLPWGAVGTAAFTGDGLYLLKRAIEWGAGAGEQSPLHDVLMVVINDSSLTSEEQQRKALLEEMGYKVALIESTRSQSHFNSSVDEIDVVFVPAHIPEADLGVKLRHAAIGVVNASNQLHRELGLYNSSGSVDSGERDIDIVEKRHYITQPLPSGKFQIFTDPQSMSEFIGSLGNALVLARVDGSSEAALAVLDTGQAMQGPDSDPAPARRVYLPWGGLPTFEQSHLHTNGRQMLQRCLEWAAGAEAVIPEALCIVRDAGSPNSDEQDRIGLLESLGYNVTLISDHDTQAGFDAAIAAIDVIFVSDTIDSAELGSRITNAPVGIVNEHADLTTELGFSASSSSADGSDIELTNNSHHITDGLPLGTLTLFSGSEELKYLSGPAADGVQTLALNPANAGHKGLATIAAGQQLYGGGTAAGRRVSLPWGNSVNYPDLTPDAVTLLERAMEWGRGLGDDGTPDAAQVKLGYEPAYSGEETDIPHTSVAMQITLTEWAIFNSITGRFYDRDKSLRYAIYSDVGGEPGNLLIETEKLAVAGNGPQWITIDLPVMTLPPGTYWLAFGIEHDAEKYFYEPDLLQQVRHKDHDPVPNGFESTWGTSESSHTRRISIYGTYTPQ